MIFSAHNRVPRQTRAAGSGGRAFNISYLSAALPIPICPTAS
jgi:hypothetical protein